MKFNIKVTQDDINGATKGCVRCPVAKALTRTLNKTIYVGHDRFMVYEPNVPTNDYSLPSIAQSFVERFDNGGKVGPFDFEVDVPDEMLPENFQIPF